MVIRELIYGECCYPVEDTQLTEFAADKLLDGMGLSREERRTIRPRLVEYLTTQPELVDFIAADDDELAEYFKNDADEYFRTPTLKEIEDEEYNRTVWEGLR